MSFSSDVKEELSKFNNLSQKNMLEFELLGYLIGINSSIENGFLRYATESQYNINRLYKLLNNLNIDYDMSFDGKSFIISFKVIQINDLKNISKLIKIQNPPNENKNKSLIEVYNNIKIQENEKRTIVRGTFLGAGSINNPDNNYHLEINFLSEKNAIFIKEVLKEYDINFKILNNFNKITLYLKEGEEISNILALIGATESVLNFEDIRVKREMRGKINRIVNCKSANLNKTINASVEQIEAIKKLQKEKRFNLLDENLKEIAILRLENPEMSLSELGKMLKNPIGKSGVNYRLKKIVEIAKNC